MATYHWQSDPANKEKVIEMAKRGAATRKRRAQAAAKRPLGRPKSAPKRGTPEWKKLPMREKMRLIANQRWEEKRKAGDTGRIGIVTPKEQILAAMNGDAPYPSFTAGPTLTRSARGFAKDAVAYFAVEGAKLRLAALDREREVLLMFIQRREP